MKHWMITLLGTLVIAGAAQAAQPQAPQPQTASAAASVPQEEAKKDDIRDRNCLRHTGTRITHRTSSDKDRVCSNGRGRVYSREDLDRTGRIDIADALRALDPSIH